MIVATITKAIIGVIAIVRLVIRAASPGTKEAVETAIKEQEQQNATQRFVWAEGNMGIADIIIDQKTGVCYLWHNGGYKGGLTVMMDAEGKPITWGEDRNENAK